ncbi:SMP-30/gluconolactonase/LRE family protein [Aureimonas frigidaquae]|uniref:SMP-30/gluconolactonase/LRE family protein n=1 Tax=Aureimonas frigidaquae TaxID=424757 RepID=UPI0007850194|nr:SMP-30/gluconolactonase/LRE family protein [Aureimonas frigidaquae]
MGAVTILSDDHCHLGEGAAWLPLAGRAAWFDIVERRLYVHDLDTGETQLHTLPVMGSVLAEIDAQRQLLASDEGIFVRHVADGRLEHLLSLEADKPGNRSNDGRVHPSGALWIGTMGRKAEKEAGSIYCVSRGGAVRLFANVTIPNAICFSPDAATAYFTDTDVNALMKVAVNPQTGLPVGEPSVLHKHVGKGGLDGAVVDAQGLIWVAQWGAAQVQAYTPEGEPVRSLPLPASNTSCPAFVGRNLDRMIVTSAWQGMGDAAKAAEPAHGQTFLIDPGARGQAWPLARPFAE